ncbi:MAG: cytochrome c biogenesis protein CcsA [Gemmatimonadetes bacterium]|nr:cytochrome c biogenesis protein CcsA [Gemmatimonadota bacterium]MDA1104206.1 cytochrome c biogenesis protein CcsA [Gemmatimonadota bacterium]
MATAGMRRGGTALTLVGLAGLVFVYWMSFFWVSTEINQGVVQRIFYVHVPAAWTSFMAFGFSALASAMYLWLRDDRLDRAALCAAEGGLVFGTIVLTTGPLWGKIAWGTYWTWEPRLTLTLLLWFIFVGYFMVRNSTEDPEKGKRFAAVVAIIGALDIPFIHMSVIWFRSLHPEPVVAKPDGPSLPADMLTTLLTSLAVFTVIFLGLFLYRYALEGLRAEADLRSRSTAT